MDSVIIHFSVKTERDKERRHAELTLEAKQLKESHKKLGHTHMRHGEVRGRVEGLSEGVLTSNRKQGSPHFWKRDSSHI